MRHRVRQQRSLGPIASPASDSPPTLRRLGNVAGYAQAARETVGAEAGRLDTRLLVRERR
jgi:hypothetical protein